MNVNILKYTPGNLGNNYIITPIDKAEKALSIVEQANNNIWADPEIKILDVACKTGILLYNAYSKLMTGLAGIIPDEQVRSKHIIDNQLYGITFNKTSNSVIRELLYGDWQDGHKNIIYEDRMYGIKTDKEYLKKIIQKEFKDMIFDVIVGNPPYQEMTNGGSTTKMAMPLYNSFIYNALELRPRYISMIIPSRWMSGGKSVLDEFRATMVDGLHIRSIHNYEKASDIFDGIDMAGGVQYFLYDRLYTGDTEIYNCSNERKDIVDTRDIGKYTYKDRKTKKSNYMIIIDNVAAKIVDKVIKLNEVQMDESVLQCRPFGLGSDFEDSLWETKNKDIKVMCSGGRDTWTSLSEISQNKEVIDKWKVCAAKVTCEHGGVASKTGDMNVLSKPFILKPNEVCSLTYLVLETFNTQIEAENCISYIKTRLARFLISVTLSGISMTSRNYMFVPAQNYSKPWTDGELYKKYNLTDEEVGIIESKIKQMD